eukprot:PhF_6_TR15422/c1_g2_i1/m.23919
MNCCVCLEEIPSESSLRMPCCGKVGGTSPICRLCVIRVAETGPCPNTGRCPLCRKYFQVERSPSDASVVTAIRILEGLGHCQCCNQMRTIVDDRHCDACVLGRRFPLVYECDRCHGLQRIPHPMWRYQPSPSEYTTDSWACQRCGDFTHWRVHPNDLVNVPNSDAPVSWGRHEEWMAELRRGRDQQQAGFQKKMTFLVSNLWPIAVCVVLYYLLS